MRKRIIGLNQTQNASSGEKWLDVEKLAVALELPDVTILELSINPDISGGNACASLQKLRIA